MPATTQYSVAVSAGVASLFVTPTVTGDVTYTVSSSAGNCTVTGCPLAALAVTWITTTASAGLLSTEYVITVTQNVDQSMNAPNGVRTLGSLFCSDAPCFKSVLRAAYRTLPVVAYMTRSAHRSHIVDERVEIPSAITKKEKAN